jgi:hypothetical protein
LKYSALVSCWSSMEKGSFSSLCFKPLRLNRVIVLLSALISG